MKSKLFLFFSCLVFLISVIYIAFVSIRGKIHAKSEQPPSKMSANLNENYRYAKTIAPKPRQDEFSELTDAELEAALEYLGALDAQSGTVEKPQAQDTQFAISESDTFEEQDIASGTDPGLKATFEFYKRNLTRHWEIAHQTTPLMNKIVELDESMDDLDNRMNEITGRSEERQKLRKTYRQLQKERAEVSIALEPLDELQAQVDKEWKDYLWAHHGMSNSQFLEAHGTALRSWLASQ
ncbi:MAG: hypothetical protein OXN17_19125 [Candidatus Poribacteria bacterium]|nr:hypothetical protein [Candidatus Poribacteria bacterium]